VTDSPDLARSRRRLGQDLRQLREQAGRTLDEVAALLDCSVAKVSRLETGQVAVRPIDLREMLTAYGVAGARRTALLSVARLQQRRAWWREYADIIYSGYDQYVGYEEEAVAIDEYHPQWVPGLLQTRAYAMALAEAYGATPEDTARLVDLRQVRQERLLGRDDAPRLSVVLDECVLRRPTPVPGLMRDQLLRLVGMSGSRVTVQVLPLDAGMHPAQNGGFVLLGFADPTDQSVVYTDNLTEGQIIRDTDHVARYRSAFDRLGALALSPNDSAALIEKLADLHR
jgi:transcriptional regulator with XRE-family HTH domain